MTEIVVLRCSLPKEKVSIITHYRDFLAHIRKAEHTESDNFQCDITFVMDIKAYSFSVAISPVFCVRQPSGPEFLVLLFVLFCASHFSLWQ